GLHISLPGTGNQVVQRWDSRGTRNDIEYDDQLRPVATFEQQGSAPRSCVERLEYGGFEPGNQAVNLCGQLTRHDSPGGTVLFESFAITRQCTRHVQHFTQEPVV
ncbi:RHS repeat protein, partial [Pseudomonas prosekii]